MRPTLPRADEQKCCAGPVPQGHSKRPFSRQGCFLDSGGGIEAPTPTPESLSGGPPHINER
jgi:hypothetical protein